MIQRALPLRARRRVHPALHIGERRVVRRDHPGAGTRLDGHVADGHPTLHREGSDRVAAVLDEMAGATAGPDARDDPEDDVLRAHVRRRLTLDRHGHGPRTLARDRLRREDVLDVARPDAERDRAQGAVGRRVAVAAHDEHARLAEPELRTDDVHDPLAGIAHRVEADAELGAVPRERLELTRRDGIGDRAADSGRDVVVSGREGQIGPADATAGEPKAIERLRRGHLVHEVEIHVQQVRLSGRPVDDVGIPDLLGQGPGAHADVTAPSAAEPTSFAYFASAPVR